MRGPWRERLGMRQIVLEAVVGELSLDAVSRAPHSVAVRASALIMKPLITRWKISPLIESLYLQDLKVVYRIRGNVRVKLSFLMISPFVISMVMTGFFFSAIVFLLFNCGLLPPEQ